MNLLLTAVWQISVPFDFLMDDSWKNYLVGKEYSKGDSRYAARDSAVVTVEGITAVLEGPASLLAV